MAHRDSARELQLEEQLRQSQDKIRRLEERLKYSGASTPVSSLPSQSSSFSGDIQVNEFPRTPSDAVFQLSASPHPSPDQIVFGFADGDSVPRTAVSHPSAPAARSTLMPDPELPIRATRAAQPMKRARTDNHDGSSLRSERMAASRSGIPSSRAASAVPLSGPMALPSSPSDGFPHPGVSTAASAGPFAGPPVCGSMRFGPFREDMSLGLTREMDPAEYLMKVGTPDMILSEPRGLGGPGIAFAGELGTAETEPASYPNGFLSACGSLTSGPTLETTAMSRLNSHNPADNVSISGQLEMVRIQSQQSTQSYASQDAYEFARHANPDTVLGKRRPSELDADFMGMGAQLAQDYSYSAPAANAAGSHPYHAAAMMRSYSNASNISMASSQFSDGDPAAAGGSQAPFMERSESSRSINSRLRAKQALSRQNQNASRSLQPRPFGETGSRSRHAAAAEAATAAAATSTFKQRTGKAPIPKHRYERPKHPKVRCPYCSDKPTGFRGEHELRRHINAKHKTKATKFICVEPPRGQTTVWPAKPLSECKNCQSGKRYNIYYNAAAHLRRKHFNVKEQQQPTKQGGGGGGDGGGVTADEKRGGKGGGDWPPMADLKLWMEEITVPCGEEARESAEDDQSVAMTEEDDVEQQEEDSAAYSSEAFPGETRESSFTDTSGSVYGEENAMARAEPFLGETVLPEDEGLDGDDFSSPMSDVLYHQRLHSVPYAAMPPTMPPSDLTYAGMHHAMTNAMFGMGGSGSAGQTYRSPGSSIATVTLENFHAEHPILPPSTTTARGDDLADMGFELAFLSQADGTLEMDEFDS